MNSDNISDDEILSDQDIEGRAIGNEDIEHGEMLAITYESELKGIEQADSECKGTEGAHAECKGTNAGWTTVVGNEAPTDKNIQTHLFITKKI